MGITCYFGETYQQLDQLKCLGCRCPQSKFGLQSDPKAKILAGDEILKKLKK